jgi:acyl-CoA reductase-like NAD-dependent aldehyde dehydrogenase
MDITILADCIDNYAGWVDKIMNETSTTPTDSFLHSYNAPIGVLGQIMSWNYPVMMLPWKLGPALACGKFRTSVY